MKPVEIYKVYHYEIALVSPSWIQINLGTTYKYKLVNDKNYELRSKSNDVKIITRLP